MKQKFYNPDDILNTMKEKFRDILQEVLETKMDAIRYKVRENKQIVVKATYVILGINMDGEKKSLEYGLD